MALSGIPTMRFVLLIPSAPPINITMNYGIKKASALEEALHFEEAAM